MGESLKLLVVTDTHFNPVDAPPKLCSQGLELLERVIEESRTCRYDLLIDAGDRINERDPQEDDALARQVAQAFERAGCDRIHLMGNHDSYFLSQSSWSDILGVPTTSRIVEIKGFRLVFFCPDVDNERGRHDYCLTSAELAWLEEALATSRLTLVFSHVPLLAGPLFGNYYFEGKPGRAEFINASAARDLLTASNAILAVGGHVHWNTWHSYEGVHYVTVQSLTESFTTHPAATGAYTILEIDDDRISIDVRGLDPMMLSLPIRKPRSRWRRPS